MSKIDQRDIILASRDPKGLALLLPRLEHLPGIMTADKYKAAYPLINAPVPNIDPVTLIHKYFPNEEVAFLLATKRAVIVYTNNGNSVEHFYGSQEKFIEIDQNQDKTLSKAFTIFSRLEREHKLSSPEGIIANDLKNRTRRIEQKRHTRVESIREVPADFWEAIEHIAKWSTCFEEFYAVIDNNSSILDSSNRNLGRIARATAALDNPRSPSEEEITIYRSSGYDDEIEAGDWVSCSENYAQSHLRQNLHSTGCLHEITAHLDEVYDTSSEDEQIYVPRETWRGFDSLESVYQMITKESKPLLYPKIEARTLEEINAEKDAPMTY